MMLTERVSTPSTRLLHAGIPDNPFVESHSFLSLHHPMISQTSLLVSHHSTFNS